MTKEALNYKKCVIVYLVTKYGLSEFEANKVFRQSYLHDALTYYAKDTIHDSIETHAENIYQDYIYLALKEM